jgi:hypothetical protein
MPSGRCFCKSEEDCKPRQPTGLPRNVAQSYARSDKPCLLAAWQAAGRHDQLSSTAWLSFDASSLKDILNRSLLLYQIIVSYLLEQQKKKNIPRIAQRFAGCLYHSGQKAAGSELPVFADI